MSPPLPASADALSFRSRLNMVLLRSSILIAVIALLVLAQQVLLVAFGAVLIAMVLDYPKRWLENRCRLPRWAAVLSIFLLLLMLSAGLLLLFGNRLHQEYQTLQQTAPQAIETVQERLKTFFAVKENSSGAGNDDAEEGYSLHNLMDQAGDYLMRGLNIAMKIFGGITAFLIMIVIALFLIADPESYRRGLVALFPVARRPRVQDLLDAEYFALSRWILGKCLAMLFVTIATIIGLLSLGIPGAFLLGLFSGLLTFIPNFGPILSAVPPILIAWAQNGVSSAAWVAVLFVVIQIIEGDLVTPLIHRQVGHLAPALVILSQLLAVVILGPLGLILAVPLMVLVQVLVQEWYIKPMEEGEPSGLKPEPQPSAAS